MYLPADCQEIKDAGFTKSGVYHITPMGAYEGLDVYCDMETDGGGWLVRRDWPYSFVSISRIKHKGICKRGLTVLDQIPALST